MSDINITELFDVFEEQNQVQKKRKRDNQNQNTTSSQKPQKQRRQNFKFKYNEAEGLFHETVYPTDYVEEEKKIEPPQAPAKEYKFNLDSFQKYSLNCLEKRESVLVAAHTSAGKTVVAEYSIAMALRDHQRVVYTSPIKALSNQKYRDLKDEFDDVGLMTGDVTIDENSSCLVMTTEILRSMLYRGSEVVREAGWIIFDEIHYMRDRERGVVWEETLILLPKSIKCVFLSATIPNAREFAMWFVSLKQCPCHVVYTDMRPVPLLHYCYPSGAEGLFLLINELGEFREENFQKVMQSLNDDKTQKKGPKKRNEDNDIQLMVTLIIERGFQPAIFFNFSKKQVELFASSLSKFDLTNEEEKNNIQDIYTNAVETLSIEDRELPPLQNMLPFLKKGIGIHHGGLLPLAKEIVEILFQEGLIKVLFSTETFSLGLNMPAKTVVFTSVKKFDGKIHRPLGSGEYVQMSGRAGRRGLDSQGICILIMDSQLEPKDIKQMLKGQADPLNSEFQLKYNMILNLTRVEDADPEYVIQRSFRQFQADLKTPNTIEEQDKITQQIKNIQIPFEIEQILELENQKSFCEKTMLKFIQDPLILVPFLKAGRLVQIKNENQDWGWGIVINLYTQKKKDQTQNSLSNKQEYVVDVLLNCKISQETNKPIPAPDYFSPGGQIAIIPCLLSTFFCISTIKVHLPKSGFDIEANR